MRADRPGGDRDLRYRRARPRRHPGARPGLPSDACLRAPAREAFDATPRAPRARERVPQMTGRGAVRRRAHGRALLWLVLANVALMLADATGYLSAADPAGARGRAIVSVATVAQSPAADLAVGP